MPGRPALSFCITSSKVVNGRSAFSGSRKKSNPETFPSLGWPFSTGDEASAFFALNAGDRSCSVFCCSGRLADTERGVWASCTASRGASCWARASAMLLKSSVPVRVTISGGLSRVCIEASLHRVAAWLTPGAAQSIRSIQNPSFSCRFREGMDGRLESVGRQHACRTGVRADGTVSGNPACPWLPQVSGRCSSF